MINLPPNDAQQYSLCSSPAYYTNTNSIIHPSHPLSAQVHLAVQQPGFVRVKRGLRTIPMPTNSDHNNVDKAAAEELGDTTNIPTDPYFQFQWYLLNTGQNGGKMRLDLNVQAAWDQGITGKNVTTAIMDDGKGNFLLSSLRG